MSDEYVSRVRLVINGEEITDFKTVEEHEIELARAVKLMNKVGITGAQPVYGVDVDYAVPEDRAEFDFTTVKDGTLIIEKLSGGMTTYNGVCTLKIGRTKYDGDNEAIRTIEFIATQGRS